MTAAKCRIEGIFKDVAPRALVAGEGILYMREGAPRGFRFLKLKSEPSGILNFVTDVLPFRGLRYNPKQIPDLSSVITPPYDVISPEEQESCYERSLFNIIRMEYGREYSSDPSHDNKYTRAATILKQWISQGILVREREPAFYLVEYGFPYREGLKSYRGLIARVRLEDWGAKQIRPHEITWGEPKDDRLRLTELCRANLSPVMGIFHGEGNPLSSLSVSDPPLRAQDSSGVTYTMWAMMDASIIDAISSYFKDKVIYIADGHHRYETALAYQKLNKSICLSYTGDEGFNFVMMALASSRDVLTLPCHRLVRGLGKEILAGLLRGLSAYFELGELLPPGADWPSSLKAQKGMAFGLYGLHEGYLLLIRQRGDVRWVVPPDMPRIWGDSDVGILHGLILKKVLGIDSLEEEHLGYTHDEGEAISRVDSGEYQLALLVNPTPVENVLTAADEGVRMPPKSTYFYPKTPAGLVINPLWDDEVA